MRPLFLVVSLLTCSIIYGQSANKIHQKAVLVDGHNDVLSSQILKGVDISQRINQGQSDLVRWKEGGLDVQFFSVWTGEKARNKEGFYKDALQQIDSLHAFVLRNPDRITLATKYKEVKKGIRQDKLVALIGVEGGHMIENDLKKLEELYQLGMRYLTLTWNNSTEWSSSAMDETERPDSLKQKGLTDFGKQVVKKMNELGVMVDLSHTGEQTFYDAIAVTTKPVILSHSSVWNICPVFRNVKDDQIKAVAKNGGVICINFYSGFISKAYDEKRNYLNDKVRDSMQKILLEANNGDSTIMRTKWREYYRANMTEVKPTLGQLVDEIDYIGKLVPTKKSEIIKVMLQEFDEEEGVVIVERPPEAAG